MFNNLRQKFIIMTMTAVLTVLSIIIGAMNLVNYHTVVRNADQLLHILSENEGEFPSLQMQVPGSDGSDGGISGTESRSGLQDAGVQPFRGGPESFETPGNSGNPGSAEGSADSGGTKNIEALFADLYRDPDEQISAETRFESRYFITVFDAEGKCDFINLDNIAAVDEETALKYAKKVYHSGKTSGFVCFYRYLLEVKEDGRTMVLFLDCNRSLNSFHSFLKSSIIVASLGFFSIMILIIIFSRRIVRPMQESYDKQKRFITDAGHELKTPLTIIDADISVLELDTGPNEWIEDVRTQTSRLAQLTNDLIFLSKMDEDQAHLDMIEFPISDILSECAQSFRSRAIMEKKSFSSDIEPMLEYRGDQKSLRQLFSILLDNALKYSPEGGSISLSLKKHPKGIELKLCNTCENISRDNMEHLFDRFYRTDESRNSSTGGYGLGLSIARAVVMSHRGKITASAPKPDELLITVTLPDHPHK